MSVRDNYLEIMETLKRESAPWGRVPKLVAVTKTVSAEEILPLSELGITDIGENRVQSVLEKWPQISGKFTLHLIGRLQTNKVKYIIDKAAMIQSLDRTELAREIDLRARKNHLRMPVLIEVSIAGEAQKGGVSLAEAPAFVRECAALPGILVSGLMTMLPLGAPRDEMSSYFQKMRALFDGIAKENIEGVQMRELSMGMSQDYDLAARYGATMVRVGTALFKGRE